MSRLHRGGSHSLPEPVSETPFETPFHRGSHTKLLTDVDASAVQPADFDAIVVPSSRPAEKYLRDAVGLAHSLDSLLVVVCSGEATADEAAVVAAERDVEVLSIDVGDANRLIPPFQTSALTQELNHQRFTRSSDLSAKRNLGLLWAQRAGWERVLFLDDDVYCGRLTDIRAAAGLLGPYDVVGLWNDGFPDNSVVCHAYRDVGGKQDAFIGGGAMAVAPRKIRSFFPDIYSEDWFFLYRMLQPRRVAVTGKVFQRRCDPYASPTRAEAEEFGDCLGEGLYQLLDDGEDLHGADRQYWQEFLDDRRRFIGFVLDRLRRREPGRNCDRMIASLEAAERVNSLITPELCLDYIQALTADLDLWQQYVEGHRAGSLWQSIVIS